jgi:hypothetical protein
MKTVQNSAAQYIPPNPTIESMRSAVTACWRLRFVEERMTSRGNVLPLPVTQRCETLSVI